MTSIKKAIYDGASTTVVGFAEGWIACTSLIVGGKLWTLLTDPTVKVSTLMGHIGTPACRRELAVGIAVYSLINYVSWRI